MRSINIDTAELNLRQIWGYNGLRPKQKEALQALSNHGRLLSLLPTGGGKSLIYQLAAIQMMGLSIVVSPLIALIEDQVSHLNNIGVKTAAVHSGHSNYDIDRILSNLKYDETKLLYVSPERLQSDSFKNRMSSYSIDLLAVDEAHCISQWGHDFRPAYKQVHSFIELVRPKYIIALTGTANKRTILEISDELGIPEGQIIEDSFLRSNIFLKVKKSEDKLKDILELVRNSQSKAVIYTRSRRQVEMISSYLNDYGVAAAYYHAGLAFKEKKNIQERFVNGQIRVVSATNAFGMGIDIADITTVIHYDIPPSMEEYYQEIGRAGRNGSSSHAELLYSEADITYQRSRLKKEFAPIEELYLSYRKVHQYFNHDLNDGEGRKYALDLKLIADYIQIKAQTLDRHLKALSKLGCLRIIDNPLDQWHVKYTMDFRAVREHEVPRIHQNLKEVLIRNYAFLKDDWFKIDITRLTTLLKSDVVSIQKGIDVLSKSGILKWHYLPEGPTILFTEGRLNKKDFSYKSSRYHKLRKIKIARQEAMFNYLYSERCLNQVLLSYFEEELREPCNNCHNCQQGKNEFMSNRDLISMGSNELKMLIGEAFKVGDWIFLKRIQRMSSEGLIDRSILVDITDDIF